MTTGTPSGTSSAGSRLAELARSEGYDDVTDLLEATITDSISPGICMRCGYTGEVEPDQAAGYCDSCGAKAMKSALILAGII